MRGLILLLGLLPLPALAHAPSDLASYWVTWALLVSLAGYLLGVLRSTPRPSLLRLGLLLSAWTSLVIALIGPVEHWAGSSLAGHMTQHMILLAIAPPLALLARPMPQYLNALPGFAKRAISSTLGRLYRVSALTPISAFIVHGLAIWFWHLPLPFQLVIDHRLLHDAVHVLFFTSGLWFWWSLIAPGRLGQGGFGLAIILALLTMMHTGMLGALLTFAPQLLYPEHPAGFGGFDELSDQQVAGLLMWVPGGMIYAAAALALTGHWLQRIDSVSRTRQGRGAAGRL
ncbi:MAG: cytochrome c oxidase assembly protein [Aquimonas sp.]|nr:cytochrome c oxidase assembly protein [Aquimonas sp.]